MSKFYNFLAVLALTAAALATIPASAYGAYRVFLLDIADLYSDGGCTNADSTMCRQSNRFFVAVSFNEEDPSAARTAADMLCGEKQKALTDAGYTLANSGGCGVDGTSNNPLPGAPDATFVNQCFAYAGRNRTATAANSPGIGDDAAAARKDALETCEEHSGGNFCQLLDLTPIAVNITTFAHRSSDLDYTTAVCDQTCVLADNQFKKDSADVAGCREPKNHAECEAVDDAQPESTGKRFYDNRVEGKCRVADLCEGEHQATDGLGGCQECDADEMANADNNGCVAISCKQPSVIEDRKCVCVGDFQTIDDNCLPRCGAHEERRNNNECFCDLDDFDIVGDKCLPKCGANLVRSGETCVASGGDGEDGETDSDCSVGLDENCKIRLSLIAIPDNNGGNNGGNGGGNGGNGGDGAASSGGGGSSGGGAAAGIVGGLVVIGLAVWYIASDSNNISWTPSYAFRHHNGNMSYSAGSRWTATVDDWRLYWQTRQNGDRFVYGSGMRYNNGILSAVINSESAGKQTDLDLNLSANKTVGLWHVGGGYRFDMELSETETDTKNRLNAKIRYTMDKWILSANANTDGDRAAARINYSYRF